MLLHCDVLTRINRKTFYSIRGDDADAGNVLRICGISRYSAWESIRKFFLSHHKSNQVLSICCGGLFAESMHKSPLIIQQMERLCLSDCLITRAQSFPRAAEFRAEPRNLGSAEFEPRN